MLALLTSKESNVFFAGLSVLVRHEEGVGEGEDEGEDREGDYG